MTVTDADAVGRTSRRIHVIARALEPEREIVPTIALLERHVMQVRRLIFQAVLERTGEARPAPDRPTSSAGSSQR